MERRRYLFSYDISDDKRRTEVFKTLRSHGDHAQYSVFFCELKPMELVRLKARLSRMIHHREDQIIILDLGPAAHPLDNSLECIGRAYNPPARVFIV